MPAHRFASFAVLIALLATVAVGTGHIAWADEKETATDNAATATDESNASESNADESIESSATQSESAASQQPDESTAPTEPTEPAPPLSPELARLKDKIARTLAVYERRQLNTRDHSPWEIMHAFVAFGCDTQVRRGGPSGEPVSAIGWLCWNLPARGQSLLYRSGEGIGASYGPGLEGHGGQFLALLAQSRVPIDYQLKVGGKEFTVADLVEYEKLECQAGSELTFRLIGLSHYLGTDAKWKNRYGQDWDVERLIEEEIKQPIRGATCGGSHRLFGMSYALKKRIKSGQPVSGQFARAQKYLSDYHRFAFSLQNDDGSMSTAFFWRREASSDLGTRLNTTGHVLEWLAFSLPEKDLSNPRAVKAYEYLADLLYQNQNMSWSIGPLGHALHGLVIYQDRMFGSNKKPAPDASEIAERPPVKTARLEKARLDSADDAQPDEPRDTTNQADVDGPLLARP